MLNPRTVLFLALALPLASAVKVANVQGIRIGHAGAPVSLEERATSCTLTAAGAGQDDAPAFLAAYTACATTTIPVGTTLNISSKMDMTGQTNKHISVQGTIRFNPNIQYWAGNSFFIPFQNQSLFWLVGGHNVLIDGGGTLDGAGQAWYDGRASNSSLVRPIVLTVSNGTNVTVKNIKIINGPEWNVLIQESKNVIFDNVNISAATTSKNSAKNTDGWDIYRSDSVIIQNSYINNGDDCVSFKPNVTNVLVSNLSCNGSHGISVGSLGQYAGVYDIVENVTATNIKMSNAQNGARIKAWAGPNVGSGIVKNITFSFFTETNVDNPVVIDQCYFTSAADCEAYPSNTYIQDIYFTNITGTGTKSDVATLDCSPGGRCTNVNVNNLSLTSSKSVYECENVSLKGNSASLFGTCTTT